jgi:hypothetical protein
MNTALTIGFMAAIIPVFTLIGVFVGHKLTIKSQQTNEQQNNRSL